MPMPADPVASLPSGLIDRLLRAALAAPNETGEEPVGRFAARLLLELADRDDDERLHAFLAAHPWSPPTFGVRVLKVGGDRPDQVLDGLGASRALRAAAARVGIDDETVVEVVAHEPTLGARVVFRADAGQELTFLLPGPESDLAPDHDGPTVVVDLPRADLLHAISEAVADLSVQIEVQDLSDSIGHAVDRAIAESGVGGATGPTAAEVADAVRSVLSETAPPSAAAIAAALVEALPVPSSAPTAEEIAAAVRAVVPAAPTAHDLAALVRGAVPAPPTAAHVAEAVRASLPTAERIAAEVAARQQGPDTQELAQRIASRLPVPPTPDQVAASLAKAVPVPPTADAVAALVASRLPAQPSLADIAERVRSVLPELPTPRDVAEAVAAVVPSADDIAGRVAPSRVDVSPAALSGALEPLLAAAIRPLLPTARDVAVELVPELERLWSRMEKTTLDRVLDVPRASELDQLRTELRELQEQLQAVRTAATSLTEEVVGSARRSRDQVDALSNQLGEDLHRWSRRIEDRMGQRDPGRPSDPGR